MQQQKEDKDKPKNELFKQTSEQNKQHVSSNLAIIGNEANIDDQINDLKMNTNVASPIKQEKVN